MKLFRFSIKNPVLIHMLTIGAIVFGTYSFISMPRELYRDMSFNWAIVSVWYLGASPDEMEKLVSKPIEDEVSDVDKIETISSVSQEGRSTISIKFDQEISRGEFDKLVVDLQTELDKVELPADAEKPNIFKLDSTILYSMLNVVVGGDLPEERLKEISDQLKGEIEEIDHIGKVMVYGVRDREIWVELDPDRLDQHNLSIHEVVASIGNKNVNLPGGKIEIAQSEYLIRTIGEFENLTQLKNLIVRQMPNGGKIRLKDIAEVKDTHEDWKIFSRLDGKPAITLVISKRAEGSTITIAEEIKKIVEEFKRARLPEGVQISLASDTSLFISDFIWTLEKNALVGMLLVCLTLYIFMGLRNALFVVLGVPFTLLLTFGLMKLQKESINGEALFGLVLVLGIIVDDAIVVMENVYRRMQKGEPPMEAAVNGVAEVAMPIVSASLTTIAAFAPLAFLPGIVGKFMRIIPIVASMALVASLFEAFFILPLHVAEWGKVQLSTGRDRLMRSLLIPYRKLLLRALRQRYWLLLFLIIIMVMSMATVPLGLIKVDMFAADEMPIFYVYVEMPIGTEIDATDRVMRQFEEAALSLPESERNAIMMRVGLIDKDTGATFDGNIGTMVVDLVEAKKLTRSVDEIIDELREKCRSISGTESVEFKKADSGPPAGADVEILVSGKNFDRLEQLSSELKIELAKTAGVHDIRDNYQLGKKELRIRIDEEKASQYGLTVRSVAGSVWSAFNGTKATVFHDKDDEIDVIVKFKKSARSTMKDLREMKLISSSGVVIPLKDVAQIDVERGPSKIHRFKRKRTITINASVDEKVITSVEVNRQIQDNFNEMVLRYPGCSLSFEGEFAEFEKAFSGILNLFGVGVLLVYFILGSQFRSFVQPLIIMTAIPFAFVGAMVGLLVSQTPLSIASMYGMVALAGIVVNDSIVLIEFINRLRGNGSDRWKAIIEGASARLRPIILTSVTTIFGLLPMALGVGGQSATWMPMASTIVWGLAIATLLILFVVPALYAIVEDFSRR